MRSVLRKMFFLLAAYIFVCFSCQAHAEGALIASGTYGGLDWTLDQNWQLKISGNGEMQSFFSDGSIQNIEWRNDNYRRSIKTIVIEEGVTNIGDGAFSGCDGLDEVSFPASLNSIGNYSFSGCGLPSLTIPDGVISIGNYAFYYSENLMTASVPLSVESIGDEAFSYCDRLVRFYYGGSSGQWFKLYKKLPGSGGVIMRYSLYDIILDDVSNGSVDISVDGKSEPVAARGDIVRLTTTPQANYELDLLQYVYTDYQGNYIIEEIKNNTFRMPSNTEVTVRASFKKVHYSVFVENCANGSVTSDLYTVPWGDVVTLSISPSVGYELEAISVKQDDIEIPVTNNSFIMPVGNVVVTPTFKKAKETLNN